MKHCVFKDKVLFTHHANTESAKRTAMATHAMNANIEATTPDMLTKVARSGINRANANAILQCLEGRGSK
jgi:hypothetical protein